ncbi:acyltransferase, partial [Streptomyces sp. NPDC001876]|uniref:acyltransferase family protein n=1 Tax=Streptomyces sp. NPDC001876 TaxID=3154402 RepID=UPI003318724B
MTSYGSYGVQLFFLISGFVICLSAWDRTPGQFVRARFLRLFPAYWFSAAVAFVVWRALPDGSRTGPSISESLTNLTMLQVPLSAQHLVGAYWTLWAELTFCLIFLLVIWKGLDYRRVSVFCWLWLLASVLIQQENNQVPILGIFAQPLNTALFVGGIAMYLMYRFGPDLKLWCLLAASWLVMQSDLVQHADGLRHDRGMDREPYVALALVTVFYLLVLAVALHKLDRIRWDRVRHPGRPRLPAPPAARRARLGPDPEPVRASGCLDHAPGDHGRHPSVGLAVAPAGGTPLAALAARQAGPGGAGGIGPRRSAQGRLRPLRTDDGPHPA